MPALLAIVQALLTPNLRRCLPFVIMHLMLQGIHPEIIFNLIPYVAISRQQHEAIMMAWTLLREFSSILPPVKGVRPQTFQGQRSRFRLFPQDRVSLIFMNFQNSVLKKMFVRFGFAGTLPTLPSLDVLKNLAINLAIVRTVHSVLFPLENLFVVSNQRLVLMKTVLEIQDMIEHVRLFNSDIVSFLKHNKNALMNIIMVWKNQVIVKQVLYESLDNILEDVKMNQLFAFLILAVIDPDFIDGSLAQIIANCGNRNVPLKEIEKYLQILKDHCQSIAPMISGHFLDIGQVLDCFSWMNTSMKRSFQVRYALRQWSIAFGSIVPSDRPEFEEVTIEQGSWVPIFDVFSRFWNAFFRNFARTFEVSFLPFGNIPWSEGFTRLCSTNFDWIIHIAVENFALRIGAKDNHAFLRSKISWMSKSKISTAYYGSLIFPDGIRNYRISGQICSCFLRDFWLAHRKPDPDMSDDRYLRWLFSIPGTFAVFGKSSIELMDALQNGTELPKNRDGSSGDFTYLSFPTDPTDPEVQQEYDRIFGEYFRQLGRDPQISDYFEGETAVPPLPPML